MKNKRLKILALLVPVLFIGIMIYLFINFQNKKAKLEVLQNIPSFAVKDINGKNVTQNDICFNNKVLVYFATDCGYCQSEMLELSKINHLHKDVHWIMFSSQSIEEIRKFAVTYNLQNVENIKWCTDPKAEVYSKFVMKGVPYFLGYNSENKLVHRSIGAIKIEKVLADFNGKK